MRKKLLFIAYTFITPVFAASPDKVEEVAKIMNFENILQIIIPLTGFQLDINKLPTATQEFKNALVSDFSDAEMEEIIRFNKACNLEKNISNSYTRSQRMVELLRHLPLKAVAITAPESFQNLIKRILDEKKTLVKFSTAYRQQLKEQSPQLSKTQREKIVAEQTHAFYSIVVQFVSETYSEKEYEMAMEFEKTPLSAKLLGAYNQAYQNVIN